jgi:hypothetical protein
MRRTRPAVRICISLPPFSPVRSIFPMLKTARRGPRGNFVNRSEINEMHRSPLWPGFQDCNPAFSLFTDFDFRKMRRPPPDLNRKDAGTGIALLLARYGFSREMARCTTFWKFVISGMEFTRGSLHPASGSDGAGGPLPPSSPRVHARRLRGYSTLLEFPRRFRALLLPSPLLDPLS